MFTRLVVDGTPAFDRVPSGYQGKLYTEIAPRTFPVRVRQGTRLNQLRLRRRTSGQPENYRPILTDRELSRIDQELRRDNDGGWLEAVIGPNGESVPLRPSDGVYLQEEGAAASARP